MGTGTGYFMNSLNWETAPKQWDQLIQVTDDYVVHARGWTVEDDILLDEYNAKLEHKRWWKEELGDKYGFSWKDDRVLYWSITGSNSFIVQYPRYGEHTESHIEQLRATLDELNVPDSINVRWKETIENSKIMTAGEI